MSYIKCGLTVGCVWAQVRSSELAEVTEPVNYTVSR